VKWIAAAIVAGALIIALAISAQPAPTAPAGPTPSLADIDLPDPQTEYTCLARDGVWVVTFGVGTCQGETH